MDVKTYDSALLNEEDEQTAAQSSSSGSNAWTTVTYAKRNRKTAVKADAAGNPRANGTLAPAGGDAPNVFLQLEQRAEIRRRGIEAQRASAADLEAPRPRSRHYSDDEGDSDDEAGAGAAENGKAEEAKKQKPKKPKKPKITVAEAASRIDADDLGRFMAETLVSYETQQDIQLMRFADYFGRAFASVNSSQFPWTKMFRESPLAKIADVPLCYISEAVYKTSVEWINQRASEALASFVLWSLDSILADLASHQAVAKGSKKGGQQTSSRSQVAIFVVLAMVLRRKPDVLTGLLQTLRASNYQGQDKLPVIVWMIAQACQGDLAVGLFCWARNLLPVVASKNCNPQSRDLVLQLVERILAASKARAILLNGAVRKGERLVPPSSLEVLMRVTFPASSARAKATERFEAVYPTLKEVALAGSPGSKATRQLSQQIFSFTIKAAAESIPALSMEATQIFIWCLTQNSDCYKLWDNIYLDNLEASVIILKRMTEDWNGLSLKQSSPDPLTEALRSFRKKNEDALAGSKDAAQQALHKDADKYCKVILGRVSSSYGCITGATLAIIALAVSAAVMAPNMESWNWDELQASLARFISQ